MLDRADSEDFCPCRKFQWMALPEGDRSHVLFTHLGLAGCLRDLRGRQTSVQIPAPNLTSYVISAKFDFSTLTPWCGGEA